MKGAVQAGAFSASPSTAVNIANVVEDLQADFNAYQAAEGITIETPQQEAIVQAFLAAFATIPAGTAAPAATATITITPTAASSSTSTAPPPAAETVTASAPAPVPVAAAVYQAPA